MTSIWIISAAWLGLASVLATVAAASKMSFLAWLVVGFLSPVLLLVLAVECCALRVSPGHFRAMSLEA